mmetsp:Transcript_56107/g.89308  ORF Transcript_56107/g.89308 Transcript_56107/m.89308 type:complete len:330 (-) Transcript_56107:160-1149(-)
MSWFRNKSGGNDKARKRHMQSMMSRNGKTYNVVQLDRNTYRVSFRTRMGETSFTVLLSEQFPDLPPRLFCDAKYSHPLLDTNGNLIGIEELNRWNANYSDLGKIVQSAVNKFIASPPTLKQAQPYQPVARLPQHASSVASSAAGSTGPPSYQQHKMKKQESMLDMASIKYSIPQRIDKLDELSSEQIDEMVKQPKLIEQFAYEVCSGLREMRQSQQSEVARIARSNMSKKEEILEVDKEVQALREQIDTLSAVYSDLKARQDKELQKFSKQRINQALNQEIEASDAATNEIKDKFDEGDVAPVAFVKKYVKERQRYHLLSIKKEKMNIF